MTLLYGEWWGKALFLTINELEEMVKGKILGCLVNFDGKCFAYEHIVLATFWQRTAEIVLARDWLAFKPKSRLYS